MRAVLCACALVLRHAGAFMEQRAGAAQSGLAAAGSEGQVALAQTDWNEVQAKSHTDVGVEEDFQASEIDERYEDEFGSMNGESFNWHLSQKAPIARRLERSRDRLITHCAGTPQECAKTLELLTVFIRAARKGGEELANVNKVRSLARLDLWLHDSPFLTLAVNGDDLIERREFDRAMMEKGATKSEADSLFSIMDGDHDGHLSRTEVHTYLTSILYIKELVRDIDPHRRMTTPAADKEKAHDAVFWLVRRRHMNWILFAVGVVLAVAAMFYMSLFSLLLSGIVHSPQKGDNSSLKAAQSMTQFMGSFSPQYGQNASFVKSANTDWAVPREEQGNTFRGKAYSFKFKDFSRD